MPIWVRSQDKAILVECNTFRIRGITPTQHVIENDRGVQLGEYFSRKEAMEALEEIAKQVKPLEMPERGGFGNGEK